MLRKLMNSLVVVEEDGEPVLSEVLVVLCNCSPGESAMLARALVGERLAACVNVVRGVTSYYEWKGELEVDEEHTLLIKTAADRFDELEARLVELHSYDNPEVIALGAVAAAELYERWVVGQTRGGT